MGDLGINPTEADVGRQVIYHGHAGERESGVITSFNDSYVFVRYGLGSTSAATDREQLTWAFEAKASPISGEAKATQVQS